MRYDTYLVLKSGFSQIVKTISTWVMHYSDFVFALAVGITEKLHSCFLLNYPANWSITQSNVKNKGILTHASREMKKRKHFVVCCYLYCWNKDSQSVPLSFHFITQQQRSSSLQRADETLDLPHINRLWSLKAQSFTFLPKVPFQRPYEVVTPGPQKSARASELNPFSLFPTTCLEIPAKSIPLPCQCTCGIRVVYFQLYLKIQCTFITVNFQSCDFHHLKDAAVTRA